MEAPFENIVELWCPCCMMMFRWTNKQPGPQMFRNICGHCQNIYDWMSPLNKRPGLPFILNTAVYGGKRLRYICSFVYFHFFETLNGAFEVHLFRASFLHLIKDTGSMGHAAQICRVKTLLNNAFKLHCYLGSSSVFLWPDLQGWPLTCVRHHDPRRDWLEPWRIRWDEVVGLSNGHLGLHLSTSSQPIVDNARNYLKKCIRYPQILLICERDTMSVAHCTNIQRIYTMKFSNQFIHSKVPKYYLNQWVWEKDYRKAIVPQFWRLLNPIILGPENNRSDVVFSFRPIDSIIYLER